MEGDKAIFFPPVRTLGKGRQEQDPVHAAYSNALVSFSLQMFRRRANGALQRSDSQQAVKSPPLLVRGPGPWISHLSFTLYLGDVSIYCFPLPNTFTCPARILPTPTGNRSQKSR